MSGLTYEQIAANLKVDPSTVWRTVRKFEGDGTVEARKHEGEKTLTVYDELLIIQSVLDNPPFIYMNSGIKLKRQQVQTLLNQLFAAFYIVRSWLK